MDTYQDGQWSTVTWWVGETVENLTARICHEVYESDDIPESAGPG